jgi:hypothetical protein
MAFRVALSPTYEAEVKLSYFAEGGSLVDASFVATFARLSQRELDELRKATLAGDMDDAAVVARVLRGWKGVLGEDGTELPFTPANVELAMDVHPTRPATVRAFFRSIGGAREKN